MKFLNTFGLIWLVACGNDKSITVTNPAPTADIVSHGDGAEVLEGFIVTLEGVVSDTNHTSEQLTTRWKVGGEVVCDDVIPDENGSTFCDVVFAPDDTEIILEVRDAENRPGQDAIFVSVIETEQPIAEIITPESDGVYYSDQLITFEGLLSDAEDDADQLVAYWESSIDGVLSDVDSVPDNGGTVVGFGNLTEGQHAIQLHVEDTTGKLGQESVIIDVGPPNSAPLCEITAPVDGSAGPEGATVQFTGTASDVDVESDWLSVAWTSDKDGELGTLSPDSNGNITFSYADLSVNTHTISMKVSDEVGATCTQTLSYTVGTAPSITIDAPTDGDVINEGTPITFSATVSDAQDQADAVALDWVVDGSSISTQGATSSGEATFSDSSLTYGTYNLVVTATDTDGLTDSDQINFTVNGVPTAPVISINPDPATTSDGLSVSIDSPSVDPEGSTPTYSYEWQLGGQVQSSHTTSTLPSSATSKGEQWTVIVTPNDGITDGTPASASITIANTAPTLSGLSITPTGTTYNDDTLTCSATVTDPDESPVPTYEWTVNGNVIGSSATFDLTSTGVMPDDVLTCTVTVSDSDSATATDSITRTVTNRAPTLASTAINPNTNVTTDTLLTCSTTVGDADGESLTPTYTWSVGANNNAGTGTTLQLTSSMGNPGDGIVCTVDVADGYGGTAVDTAATTITNTDPVISDVSISYNGDLTSTTSLTCNHTATDADNQTLTPTYTWTNLSTNTQFSSTASTLQLNPTTVSPTDVVECSVTVTDTSNGTATLAASETVLNTEPTFITPATVTTSGTQVGDTWTCYAAGTDQDDGALTPSYEWQDPNGVFVASGASLTLSSSNSAPNADLTCVATLTDTFNATATSSASATVTNTAPTFDVSASIAPNTGVVTASLLTCSGSASDANGDTPTVSYAWSNSNGTTYGSTGNTLQLTPSTVSPVDVVTCTLTATDASGDTATSSASVTVDNTLPTLTAAISATDTSNTGELTCSATASDLDDFPTTPTLTYEWFNSNGSLGTSNPLQLDPTMGVDGDTIDCTVTATDLSGGAVTDTASLTITNTAPVIDSISLNPSTIDANTTSVTCVVSSSDADGDSVTESFEWYVDGNLQSETTNMYSGPFLVGTLLACRSTPNDGKTDGDFVEDTATIQNTAPVVDSVTLSPSTVYTNDTIIATTTLSDADAGQNLTANFEWFVDNVSVQNGSSNTLDGVSMFNRDQSVYVEVTPNDGVEDGTVVQSSAITISNTAPVMSSVTVTPDPATAGQDDLTCDVTATDADGDAILYTYEWSDSTGLRQDMIEVSDISDEYLAAGLSEDTWTCDVTPYDGTDYGSALSDSVTVESGCKSLEFLDTNYISVPATSELQTFPSGVTFETWVYLNSYSSQNCQNLFKTGGSGSGYVFCIRGSGGPTDGGELMIYAEDNPSGGLYSPVVVELNKWVHVAATLDGSTATLWYQGDNVAQGNHILPIASNDNLSIGGHPNAYTYTLHGFLSDTRISTGVRYTAQFTPEIDYPIDSDTLLLLEMSSASPIDKSGNAFLLTNYGAILQDTCPEEDLDGDGVAAWEDCDDGDATALGGANGSVESCPGVDCAQILADGYSNGDGIYWIDPEEDGGAYEVYCLMDSVYDGGGWTLISTHSDDGQDTWTWNNRHYFDTDTTTFGSLNALNEDFKSAALHDVGMQDLMFIHEPSGIWAGYNDVDAGSSDFGTFVQEQPSTFCQNPSVDGFVMTSGTLSQNLGPGLCDTKLYIHAGDCTSGNDNGYGPNWNTGDLDGSRCPFNDSGYQSGLGVNDWNSTTENPSIGFGYVLSLNTGSTSSAQNNMQVFVRRDYTDADGDGVAGWEDCDDSDASITISGTGTSTTCAGTSCKTILDDGYSTGDGTYWINPYGSPYEVECNMTYDGGGWTIILDEDYSTSVSGWNNNQITSCGSYGNILGGYSVLGAGSTLEQNFTVPPHSNYFYEFDFIQIDSWDSETSYALVDNSTIWQRTWQGHTTSGGTSQGSQVCGNPTYFPSAHDRMLEDHQSVQITDSHSSSTLSIRFETTINQSATDESWGIDNVILMVR